MIIFEEKKNLFYLIFVAIMSAIVAISCFNQFRGMNSFSEFGPEDAVGSGPNTPLGYGKETTFDIGVIYPEVKSALKSEVDISKVSTNNNGTDLTKIWKKLLSYGDKKLYVTVHSFNNSNDDVTVDNFKNLSYFDFDSSGNMVYRNNKDDVKGVIVKEFVKGVIVKISGYNGNKDGYVIGGLYKTKNVASTSGGIQLQQMILNYKIGFNAQEGSYEIIYIHPQYSFNNQYSNNNNYNTVGFSYAFYGSYNSSSSENKFESAIVPEDYINLYYNMQHSIGVTFTTKTRFYRTK